MKSGEFVLAGTYTAVSILEEDVSQTTLASFHVKLVSCRQEQLLNFSGQCVKLLGFLTLPITRLCLFLRPRPC